MKHGYMQMELDQTSKPITNFYTHRGLQQSRRLTFGINAAAEVFHEEIHQTLTDIPSVRDIYDDILIYGKTDREHNLALLRVLQHLQNCGLTLNLQKCIFSIPQIEFFRVIFSTWGVAPTQDQTTALLNATRPTTTTETKPILSMVNFSAYFILEFSSKTAHLQALTMKNAKFTWSDKYEQAFTTIKKAVCNAPVIAYFDPNRQTKLIADGLTKAGLTSIPHTAGPRDAGASGCALWQQVNNFPGAKILLVSIYSIFQRKPPPRILKHKLRIQRYNYTLQYEPGGAANSADYLSKHTNNLHKEINTLEQETENFINAIMQTCLPTALTLKEIQQAKRNDPQM